MKKVIVRDIIVQILGSSEFKRICRYSVAGIINTLSYVFICIFLIDSIKLNPLLGTSIGFISALIIAFILNSKWTFESNISMMASFLRYCFICVYGLIINISVMYVVVNVYKHLYLLGVCFVSVVMPICNYIFIKKWAFANEPSTHE